MLRHDQKGESSELAEIRSEAESILKEIGLTTYAAQALLAISESSPVAASSICHETGIADSKIYYALREIEEKGLVTKTAGTPQLYATQGLGEVSGTLHKMIESEYEKKRARIARLEKILGTLSKSSRRPDNLEIAYITRGFENVSRRASNLIGSAQKEIVGYVWDEQIYSAVARDLKSALSRLARVKLALSPSLIGRNAGNNLPVIPSFSTGKILTCECNLFVIDNKKMITITKTRADTYYAIITDDPGMISLGASYYDNPTCCYIAGKGV